MNHRLGQRQGDDFLHAPSKHGVGDDIIYTDPSGFGSIHILTRTIEDADLVAARIYLLICMLKILSVHVYGQGYRRVTLMRVTVFCDFLL
jgi:hypothetical protein